MTRPMVVLSIEARRAALERVESGEAASAIAAELGIDRQRLYAWRAKLREGGPGALRGPGRPCRPAAARRFNGHTLTYAELRELIARDHHRIGDRQSGPR